MLIIGYQMMLRDMRVLRQMEFDLVVSDDVQPLLHTETQTARAFKEIALRSKRVININATPAEPAAPGPRTRSRSRSGAGTSSVP